MKNIGLILALLTASLLIANTAAAGPVNQSVMVLFEAEIHESKVGEVRELVGHMVAVTSRDEPETLVYRAFISEDNKHLTFMETYSDTDAMLLHDRRFSETFADSLLAATKNHRLCIYGPVSETYKAFATESGFNIEYYDLVDGFVR